MTPTGCLDLDDDRAQDPAVVGHKAAGLAVLRRAGLPALEGLVVPVGTDGAQVAALAEEAAGRWDGPLAVRSSATWEDLATTARAGQSLTVLRVTGAQDVATAIRACLTGDDVAVLVQPMLAPSHAGVAFTADPVSGDRDVVRLQAVEGVADALLDGAATGIDVLIRDGAVEGATIDGDPGTLPTHDALAVAALARRVEAHLRVPQDIEWAIVDGDVHLLQARPITVLPIRPELPTGNGWQKDVSHYSEPLTPFGWWVYEQASPVVPEVFGSAGLIINGLEERLVGGEVYARVVPAVGPVDGGTKPPPPAPVMGLLARVVPALRRRTAAAARVVDGTLPDAWIADWAARRADFITLAADLNAQDLSGLSDAALVEHLGEVLDHLVDGTRCHFRVMIPWALHLHDLHRRLMVLPDWDDAATAALTVGSSPATAAPEVAMAAIRDRLATTDGAVAALEDAPHDPVGALSRVAPDLADDLRGWLGEHGWRAFNYDAGAAVLAEKPALVARVLLAPTRPSGDAEAVGDEDPASEVRARLPEHERAGFDEALARVRATYPLREDTVILAGDVLMGHLRRWLLEAGARLEERGVLTQSSDASYLTGTEVVDALTGVVSADLLTPRVVRRRGEEAWARATPGPVTIGHQGPPPSLTRAPTPLRIVNEAILWMVSLEYAGADAATGVDGPDRADVAVVRGAGASPGVAEGAVRIVRNHRDLERLQFGEVLVCHVASPGWVPTFPLCAAVVADGGGVLAHAGIAAREHGLPAVLGTVSATSVLHDGQLVRVDGTAGSVTLLGAPT